MLKKNLLSAAIIVVFLPWIILSCKSEDKPAEIQEPSKIVMCAGDSITAGPYPTYLQENLNQAGSTTQVVNKGVPGNTSGEYLNYLQTHRILQEVNPDFVLLELGTNDVRIDGDHTEASQFIASMNGIIDLVQSHVSPQGQHPQLLLATVPPIVIDEEHRSTFNQESGRRVVEEINPAIAKIATDRGLPLLDIYQLFQEHPELLPGIHPSSEGYKAMADAWFNQLAPLLNLFPK
jgi:lysophospholipase L1-like esterase